MASDSTKSSVQQLTKADVEDSTEDEELDALSQSQSQTYGRAPGQTQQHTKLPSPKELSLSGASPPPFRNKGFRIGGRLKNDKPESLQQGKESVADNRGATLSSMLTRSQNDSHASASPKGPRKPFKIGGKHKNIQEGSLSHCDATVSLTPKSSPPPLPKVKVEEPSLEEVHETPEEKAERKRAELKRRNEDIARKQLQHKKKKRF